MSTYNDSAEPFARPILIQLRAWVYQYSTDVNETVKWNFPHFEYENRILCSMAAFSRHGTFGFWQESMMRVRIGIMEHNQSKSSMDKPGRISSLTRKTH
jgi:hypothetical protein